MKFCGQRDAGPNYSEVGSWVYRGASRMGTNMTRMRMGFSDKNRVRIGSNWVRFHFLKKLKLVKSSMFNGGFAFFELGSFSRFHFF